MSDLVDTEVIIENLTELLTNTVNMTSVYYDIFLNPEEMDVKLTQYDSDGNLITVTIPNRAKDRKLALSGSGSPEGSVTANAGACYVDTSNEAVYFKASGSGNTGWVIASNEAAVSTYIQSYLADNDFLTEDALATYLADPTHTYVTTTALTTVLNSFKPVTPVSVLTGVSGTKKLDDNSIYSMTVTGNTTFQLPDVGDTTKFHKILVQLTMASDYTIIVGTTYYFNKTAPSISTAGSYDIKYEYDNTTGHWYCGATPKGEQPNNL